MPLNKSDCNSHSKQFQIGLCICFAKGTYPYYVVYRLSCESAFDCRYIDLCAPSYFIEK